MKRLKSIALTALAVLVSLTFSLQALPVNAQNSASLSIAPKKNYVIEPGKSVEDKLTIRNLDNTQSLQLNLRVIDFSYMDSSGTPKLMLGEDLPQTTWSLKPFLSVPEYVTIDPSSSKSLDISVSIPANQGAGSYYSAIIYSTGSPNGGNVGLSASGVTLVFVSIPGKVHEDLQLKNFGAYDKSAQGDQSGYMFMTADEPQVIGYTLLNNGNVTESPVGSITLKDMFGREQIIDNINPTGALALIGQTRTFTTCIKLKSQDVDFRGTSAQSTTCTSPGLWPGVYVASLDLYYGQNGNNTNEITKTTIFWYLPWWFVILAIIVLLLIAYFVWRFVRWFRGKFYGPKPPKGRRLSRRR